MSNAGQAALGIVGGIIGWFIGGPQGAYYGFQIGLGVGTFVSPTQLPGVQGPRLEDFRTTSAQLGAPVHIVYGTIAIPGQIIWLAPVREESSTETQGGKGAPEQDVTTYSYFQSIAVGLCEGPIAGVRRVWENGTLVYDRRQQQEGEDDTSYQNRIIASNIYEEGFVLYLGDEEQEADPTIEAQQGVGNVPGFRGLAYIVFPERQLKDDQARRHPNFKFEVYTTGELECEDVVAYSNEVLYPWASGDDPLSDLNDHTVTGGSTGSAGGSDALGTHDSVAEALSHAENIRGVALSSYLGHDIQAIAPLGNNSGYTNRMGSSTAAEENSLQTSLHYNLYDPGSYSVGTNFNDNGAPSYCSLESYHRNIAIGSSGAGAALYFRHDGTDSAPSPWQLTHVGPCFTWSSRDVRITVRRVPRAPDNPCEPRAGEAETSVDFPGYCVVDGLYIESTAWIQQAGTWRVLQEYGEDSDTIRYPLNPARPSTHPEYTDQDFWEAAYAEAVANGDMSSGLTYGVDYPTIQAFGYVREYQACTVTTAGISLADIVSDICERVGLTDIDVSDLEDRTVIGYAISRVVNARGAIEPLRQVGFFDVVESGTTVKFPTRGKAIVATLAADDLGAMASGGEDFPPSVLTKKAQDVELPRQLRVHYIDPDRDYEPGEQLSPTRLTTESVNDVDVELAVAIDGTQAAKTAEVLWAEAWAARWQHETALDFSWLKLEPSDCITLPVDGRAERVRIVSADDSATGIRRLAMVRDDDGSYVSEAIAQTPAIPGQQMVVYSATELVLMDLPALRDEDNTPGIYAACYAGEGGNTWRGAVIQRSADDGASFQEIGSVANPATVGQLVSLTAANAQTATWDETAEIIVDLLSGELESATESAVLSGANAAAIGADDRWQVIQFKNAELVSDGRWKLTGILHGRRGTEHFVGTNQVGDTFVLLSGAGIVRLPLQISEIGAERTYRAVSLGTTPSTAEEHEFVGEGVALETFSPVLISGSRDSSGDLAITWIRRGRIGQELRSGADIPLSEESEEYEIDIISDGSPQTVLRTLEASEQEVVYTAAQIEEDFGSPIPDLVTVRIYQLSAVVGRGTPGEATI